MQGRAVLRRRAVTVRTATGRPGLRAMELTGGVEHAVFGLEPGHGYPPARGARIAKTYAQLAGGPRTGTDLFRELEAEDWRLPRSGRRYEFREFRAHLRYMVRHGRLHVVLP